MIQTPLEILRSKQGDCDDKSILLATLLKSKGHKTRFIAVGFHPGVFSHVYVQVLLGKDAKGKDNWFGLDATELNGWNFKPYGIKDVMYQNNFGSNGVGSLGVLYVDIPGVSGKGQVDTAEQARLQKEIDAERAASLQPIVITAKPRLPEPITITAQPRSYLPSAAPNFSLPGLGMFANLPSFWWLLALGALAAAVVVKPKGKRQTKAA